MVVDSLCMICLALLPPASISKNQVFRTMVSLKVSQKGLAGGVGNKQRQTFHQMVANGSRPEICISGAKQKRGRTEA